MPRAARSIATSATRAYRGTNNVFEGTLRSITRQEGSAPDAWWFYRKSTGTEPKLRRRARPRPNSPILAAFSLLASNATIACGGASIGLPSFAGCLKQKRGPVSSKSRPAFKTNPSPKCRRLSRYSSRADKMFSKFLNLSGFMPPTRIADCLHPQRSAPRASLTPLLPTGEPFRFARDTRSLAPFRRRSAGFRHCESAARFRSGSDALQPIAARSPLLRIRWSAVRSLCPPSSSCDSLVNQPGRARVKRKPPGPARRDQTLKMTSSQRGASLVCQRIWFCVRTQ
jgi:hypothetical protein